jgi:hypothetical protein
MGHGVVTSIMILVVALVSANTRVHRLAPRAVGGLTGGVMVTDARGDRTPAAGVRLTIACAGTEHLAETVSRSEGQFEFDEVPTGACTLTGELPGFARRVVALSSDEGRVTTVSLDLDIEVISSGLLTLGPSSCRRFPRHGR